MSVINNADFPKRLFIDMDGTLARFHDEPLYLERMFEKGFFKNLAPFQNLVDGINAFSKMYPETEIYILSAYVQGEPPFCQKEKDMWISEFLPQIDKNHRLFTPMGADKSDYILGGITKYDYLLDDYNKNLEEWKQAGGCAVKCKNNINHKGLIGPLWQGDILDNSSSPANIAGELALLMNLPPQLLSVSRERGI